MGIVIALVIIAAWFGHLFAALAWVPVNPAAPWFLPHTLIQAYLFTGVFITAHDAMHGTVSANRRVNDAVGRLSTFLFMGFAFGRMRREHIKHHRFSGAEGDPDFSLRSQNIVVWFASFFAHYIRLPQILVPAVIFNLLRLRFPVAAIFAYWIVPAFLSTFQLFVFGTYGPHKRPHTDVMAPHNARTQRKNHLWAMVSCYFFGYHWEHHQWPRTPWWQLYRRKDQYRAMVRTAAAPNPQAST